MNVRRSWVWITGNVWDGSGSRSCLYLWFVVNLSRGNRPKFLVVVALRFSFFFWKKFFIHSWSFNRASVLASRSNDVKSAEDSSAEHRHRAGGHQPGDLGSHRPAETPGVASRRGGKQERVHLHPDVRDEARKGFWTLLNKPNNPYWRLHWSIGSSSQTSWRF